MFEIYAYGNADSLAGVFNAIAAIMGGGDYFGLIRTIAITGVLVAACSGLFTPGRFHGWGWLIGFLLLYYALFLPKSDVIIIDKLGGQAPTAVGNVPLGVAFFGHATSKIGDVMTRAFETAFQSLPSSTAQLPTELTYQRNGVLFGNRLIQATRQSTIADPQLRTDLIAFVHNCTLYDLQDRTIDPASFVQSTDIWPLMANTNPARFTPHGNPVQVDTCPIAYATLAARLPPAIAHARATLALRLNPGLDVNTAQAGIDNQIEQAYYKTKLATAAQAAGDLLRQNILINLVQDSGSIASQKLNDPAALMIATGRASATASLNAAFLTMGKVAEQALPLIRNVIEAILYAVFPFVFLILLLAHGRGLGMALKSFVMSLIWIQLWPPLYAILNYVATLASARNLEAAARMGTAAQGLALDTAGSIYQGALSDQAIAGYMVISIPIIATAIIKGGEVAFQAITGVAPMQSAISTETGNTTKGNLTQDAVSIDQQQLAPSRTSPYMTTSTDAHGSTTQGLGNDSHLFRYQANLSRLATTYTFSERQATQLADSAREAETTATSTREALQRSQSTALTNALSLHESFERAQSKSTSTTASEASGTATQLQTLNGIAQEVNRRLGLSHDSTVGKSVAASASAGLKIPILELGGQATLQNNRISAEHLQSAHDQARKSIESTQIADATTLTQEFRTSDAYQWARTHRKTGASSFDSASREALDQQSVHEQAQSRAKELARTAQFMREWGSGANTDFTNHAAQRLAERGLLREDDPIKLQRAITEIATSYAKGGDVTNRFIPSDSPMPVSPAQLLGWDKTSTTPPDNNTFQDTQQRHRAILTREQQAQGVTPTQSPGSPATSSTPQTRKTIEQARQHISDANNQQSTGYNSSVNINTIANHGGNRAVWDTVGAQTNNRAGQSSQPGTPNTDTTTPNTPLK